MVLLDRPVISGSLLSSTLPKSRQSTSESSPRLCASLILRSIRSIFVPWLAALRARLLSSYPLPQGLQPIRPEVSLPPKYTLRILETVDFTTIDTSITMPASSAFRLTQNQRVTPINHEQDVRHMKFTTPCGDIPYLPGDVLAIHPSNSDKDVNELIDLMEWHEVADTPLAFNSPTRSGLSARDGTTLRRLLKYKLDITAVPKLRFVAFMSDWCVDPTHKERLLEYLNPADTEEFLDFATRPRRTILEILHDLPVKFPWEHAVTIFPLIKPRQYSICSGGALNRHSGNDLVDVQLLIAVVKYRTVLKKFRTGLCTQYLAALPTGSLIEAVHIQGSMMDKAMTTDPAIYIATGTGIAPIRSLIWQQAEDGPEKLAENSLLVFGCRNESADYFFKHEWQVLSLKVLTAFSRDQRQKIYVQDVISMNGRAIWQLLKQRARVFVCGSAGKMPKAVRLAILKVIKAGLEMDDQPNNDADADNWLKDHERAGRYFQEVW